MVRAISGLDSKSSRSAQSEVWKIDFGDADTEDGGIGDSAAGMRFIGKARPRLAPERQINMHRIIVSSALLALSCSCLMSQEGTLRQAVPLEQQLNESSVTSLADIARQRGDAKRGAFLFHTSPAACINCHSSDKNTSPLGPRMEELGDISDAHVIESLLQPSKSIRKGYETQNILMADGRVMTGLVVASDDKQLTFREASDLGRESVILRDDIEAIRESTQSMMPDGLIASLPEQRDFMDLAKYIMDVAKGGPKRAAELRPTREQLEKLDDTRDLDHASIIGSMRKKDFEAGKAIYHGYCFNCHGSDGNTPSLPTARAFGTQKLRFGSDPFRMFMTLSQGNGLMAPMRHLTPHERYQVVHYVREEFMKPSNPDYTPVKQEYLDGLPPGTKLGTEVPNVDRDFGPALASQLRREFSSVLSVRMGDVTMAYDLHSMDQADLWRGGFLDLSQTQHVRDRGEGTADPDGASVPALSTWKWGHDNQLDYPTDGLLERGPLPANWFEYNGHYLFGEQVVFSYRIDGRDILESPRSDQNQVTHRLEIGPGKALLLCVADGDDVQSNNSQYTYVLERPTRVGGDSRSNHRGSSLDGVAIASQVDSDGRTRGFVGAFVTGDVGDFSWLHDEQHRIVLSIPASDRRREVEITRAYGSSSKQLDEFRSNAVRNQTRGPASDSAHATRSLEAMTGGGPTLWEDEITSVGFLGLERGNYALDTITLPDSTPWNTWFRTSALDFLSDGRMVVTTYGGDVWIVSGIDNDLSQLTWKRFAGGLYEPFGVKVVDDLIYVTCKDRLTRLHDLNDDGEADFYESFSADTDVSVNFHAFNFDLQTDEQGNFYYSKSGHGSDSEIPGQVVKVSRDGRNRETFCTGFRTPNGMGMLPDGRPTNSDNQGQWMPASKINLLKPGGFYGWVQTYSIPGKWEPGGGEINVEQVVPPSTFDQPLVWMPQSFDNSSGGQLWVDDRRFGPLSGHLLHTSFGKGWMSYLMIQDFGDVAQAAIIKLPFDFRTGIMRARVNPADGQVYATGLQGWNGGGRVGLRDNGIQRLRYTGQDKMMVIDCTVEDGGLRITLNQPANRDSATQTNAYELSHWNYHWRRQYGSDKYSPSTDEIGPEELQVESIALDADGRTIHLRIPGLVPVDQLRLMMKIKGEDGSAFEEEIYWTIHRVPNQGSGEQLDR